MVKALILYNSLFGNTRLIAEKLALGIKENVSQVKIFNINEIEPDSLIEFDFIAIGGPTHNIGLSKDMKDFFKKKIKHLKLKGKTGFAFDTRKESKLNNKKYLMFENSAARKIESKMKRMKIKIIKPRESALIEPDRKGPLKPGVDEQFFLIGKEIGQKLVAI